MAWLICVTVSLQVTFGLNSSTILTSALRTRAGNDEVIGSSKVNTTLFIYRALHSAAVGSLLISVAKLPQGYFATSFLDAPREATLFPMLMALLTFLGKDIPSIKG